MFPRLCNDLNIPFTLTKSRLEIPERPEIPTAFLASSELQGSSCSALCMCVCVCVWLWLRHLSVNSHGCPAQAYTFTLLQNSDIYTAGTAKQLDGKKGAEGGRSRSLRHRRGRSCLLRLQLRAEEPCRGSAPSSGAAVSLCQR